MTPRFALGLAAVSLLLAAAAAAGAAPPATPTGSVTDTLYGVTIKDPYRWMEAEGPDFTAWAGRQNAVTRAALDSLPGYAAIARDVAAWSNADIVAQHAQRVGDLLYYEEQLPGEAQASLFVRPFAGGAARRLVNPVKLSGPATSINEYAVSADNSRLAYSLAKSGTEDAVLRFLDLRTAKPFPEQIDRGRNAGPVWSADDTLVFYTRLKSNPSGPADRMSDEVTYRHRVGEDPAHDQPVFSAASVNADSGRSAFIGVFIPPGSAYALAFANSGVSLEAEWFTAPTASLLAGAAPHWTRLAHLADKLVLTIDGLTNVAPTVRGDHAWFACFANSPNMRIVRLDLRHPTAPPTTIVPERQAHLAGMAVASDGLYLAYAEGGRYSLRHTGLDGAGGRDIAMPYDGTITEIDADPKSPGAIVLTQSWARPARMFRTTGPRMADLDLTPQPTMDLSPIITDTIEATAPDGTKIPVSITYRRDIKRDGTAPALIEAYGAYGISQDATYRAQLMPLLLRGGVWALVHVRGGGEFGERWHEAGKGANKPNTWRDFIAGVHAVEAAGFTSRAHAVGFGGSAGGIMIGRAVTEAPDLLAGAVIWSPIADTLRLANGDGGAANAAEFGSAATRAGFDALREMDAYQHVKPATAYPAVLITIGLNDHRVPAWMGAKLAAALQADSTSGKPVLLRVDAQGGHTLIGASRDDFDALVTDLIAFTLCAAGSGLEGKK